MTNLDSVLKSRDTILLTKSIKSKVFPVVMYGCESWTIKKAKCQRIDAECLGIDAPTVVLEKTLESPLDVKIELVNPKGN